MEEKVEDHYFKSIDGNPFIPVASTLQQMHPGATIDLSQENEGSTDTRTVKVDGVSRHILKRASVPNGLFASSWGNTQMHLNAASGKNLNEKVWEVFYTLNTQRKF